MKTKELIIILTIVVISGIGGVLGIYFYYIAPKLVEGSHHCERNNSSQIDVDACYFNLAEETSDAGLCERMSDESAHKGTCFVRVAKQTKDTSPCEKISDEIKQHVCFAVVADDPDMCGKASEATAMSVCYFEFAIRTRNSSLCEKILDANVKNNCYLNSGQ